MYSLLIFEMSFWFHSVKVLICLIWPRFNNILKNGIIFIIMLLGSFFISLVLVHFNHYNCLWCYHLYYCCGMFLLVIMYLFAPSVTENNGLYRLIVLFNRFFLMLYVLDIKRNSYQINHNLLKKIVFFEFDSWWICDYEHIAFFFKNIEMVCHCLLPGLFLAS